jgi:hypothetical protein
MAIPLEPWLDLMREEYLASFIPDGGSAVRFVVAADGDQTENVSMRLRELGWQCQLTVIGIDAATTKLHLLQNLFFTIARSIDWDALTQTQLERVVVDSGYRWPDPGRRSTLAVLAEANEVAPALMRMQINQEITRTVWQDARLAQDFRNAMIALLATRLADDRDALRDAVLDWLQGAPGRLGSARDAQIGAKIGRNNARAMLKSLCHFLAVLADPPLLADDSRRSLNQYTALKMRVWDDVRPEHGDNPLAPLVQVR